MDQLPTSFFTFEPKQSSPQTFVDFWSDQFDFRDMVVYQENIGIAPITDDHLRLLFTWKNGMTLSGKKTQALEEKIIGKLSVIQTLAADFDEQLFNEHFGKVGIVWRVFLLHIIDPMRFPIFDQHVYRAYCYLQNLSVVDRKDESKLTTAAYNDYYRFYHDLVTQCGCSSKTVDDALWAFGKFLSRYPRMVLSSTKSTAF